MVDDRARAGAIERDRQFRLPPQLRKQRDNQTGAMRGKHRQHELDGVGQLHRDDRIGRQAGFDEMRRQRRDRPVGLRKGQAPRRLSGDALLVERIEQRRRIRLPGQDAVETVRRASAMRWSGSRDHFGSGVGGLLPPGFRQIAGQRGGCWSFYPIPARDPLFLNVITAE